MIRLTLAALLLLTALPALAQGDYLDEQRHADARAIRQSNCDWYGIGCRYYDYRRRYYRQRTYYTDDNTRVYGYTARHYTLQAPANRNLDRLECRPMMNIPGAPAQSEEEALNLARRALQGYIRFRHGERFTSPDAWRNVRSQCAPASVDDTLRDKLGATTYRCELSAIPCTVDADRPVPTVRRGRPSLSPE